MAIDPEHETGPTDKPEEDVLPQHSEAKNSAVPSEEVKPSAKLYWLGTLGSYPWWFVGSQLLPSYRETTHRIVIMIFFLALPMAVGLVSGMGLIRRARKFGTSGTSMGYLTVFIYGAILLIWIAKLAKQAI